MHNCPTNPTDWWIVTMSVSAYKHSINDYDNVDFCASSLLKDLGMYSKRKETVI